MYRTFTYFYIIFRFGKINTRVLHETGDDDDIVLFSSRGGALSTAFFSAVPCGLSNIYGNISFSRKNNDVFIRGLV